MRRSRIIPVLLLKDSGLFKTIKFKDPTYVGDPINTVRIFNDKEADEMVVLDISVTKAKLEPDYNLLKEIASEAFMPLTYGGGITTIERAKKVLDLGYEKISLNTALIKQPSLIPKLVSEYGSQSIVGSIDVSKSWWGGYRCRIRSGTRKVDADPIKLAQTAQELGVGEILLNSIDKDGTWEGYDLNLIRQVSSSVDIPVVACGGAGNYGDLKEAVKNGASATAAGSLFIFQKKGMGVLINLPKDWE